MPDPIRAGDRSTPLPSEVLGSLDGGRGIAAFVLRPTDLDRLPVLTTYPPEGSTGETVARLRRFVANLRCQGSGWPQRIATSIEDQVLGERVPGDEAGDLDAYPTASNPHEACEEQADALRTEVARLTGLLDDAAAEADRADRAEAELAACRAQQLRQAATITEDRRAPVVELYRDDDEVQARPGLAPDPTLDDTDKPGRATRDQTGAPIDPLDGDPHRPHPDDWPDDAVLLRYRELRDLVALHLDRYADARTARAMRSGDVPLRLAEVLR